MSSSEAAASVAPPGTPARFTLWPLPELRLVTPDDADLEPEARELSPEEEAYERGVADGRSSASRELRGEIDRTARMLAAVAEEFAATRETCAREMEEQLYLLAVAVARQVIQREVAADPTVLGDLVRKAIEQVSWEAPVTVRLHPDDLARVQEHFAGLGDDAKPSVIEWEAGAQIAPGGYLIDSRSRVVDGTLDSVLKHLHERLADG